MLHVSKHKDDLTNHLSSALVTLLADLQIDHVLRDCSVVLKLGSIFLS